MALLEPIDQLEQPSRPGDYTRRLALLEETKTLPFGAVWDHYCEGGPGVPGRARRGSSRSPDSTSKRRPVNGPQRRRTG